MVNLKKIIEKFIITIILFSIIVSFCATPASYAKLDIADDEFYYAGTQKGQYTVKEGIFSWLLSSLADVADWIVGMVVMAIRAPFVGYTALLEKLLTWALQTTSGITMDNRISNTDLLQTIETSQDNVTIEAIVYNRVPAFNINIFDTTYDTTYSPTGQKYVCTTCRKPVEECCTVSEDGKVTCSCDCSGKCEKCAEYKEVTKRTRLDPNDEKKLKDIPIIIQLKVKIAEWYYIIRLIAIAGMLVVLVGIGIKIAIASVATDKAVYKRVLMDFVAGVLIIFLIHFYLYFVILINDMLVDVIRESSEEDHKVKMMQLAEEGNKYAKYSNLDLETSIYEEIRTRAYDPKLVNGIIGTVLYISLVFMAIKYSFIYTKRFFTIAILALMSPGVGVAFAIQKAITGKSQALKTWMTEVLLNVIIQSVHAIIYAVFISTVLYLSLESIAGIIVALIVMNFATKAEKIFRLIFNIDPSGKGLLGDTEKAGDLDQKYRNMAAMLKGSKTAAKYLSKSPQAMAMKAAARFGAAAGVLTIGGTVKAGKEVAKLGAKVASKIPRTPDEVKREREIDKEMEREAAEDGDIGAFATGERDDQYEARRARAARRVDERHAMKGNLNRKAKALLSPLRNAYVDRHTSEEIRDRFLKARKAYKQDPNSIGKANAYIDAYNDLRRKQKRGDVTLGGIAVGHIERVFNIDNYFEVKRKSNGKTARSVIVVKPGSIFGTKAYNPKTGKIERKKDGILDQFRAQNLLGFTDQDAKVFKQNVTNNIANGFIGSAAMFIGLGTFVMNPTLGMGLIATGATKKYGAYSKLGLMPGSRRRNARRFTFNSFTMPTIKNMRDIALERTQQEQNKLVTQNVKIKHPKLFKRLRMGTVSAVTLGGLVIGGLPGGAIAYLGIGAIDGIRNTIKRFKVSNRTRASYAKKTNANGREERILDAEGNPIKMAVTLEHGLLNVEEEKPLRRNQGFVSEAEYNISKQYFDQMKQQQLTFAEDAVKVIGYETEINAGNMIQKMHDEELIKEFAAIGYTYNPETGELTRIIEPQKYLDEEKEKTDITLDEYTEEAASEISDVDNREINRAIEAILVKISSTGPIDINDEARINQVLRTLDAQLFASNILKENQKTIDIFKDGRKGLVKAIKRKSSYINSAVEFSTSDAFSGMSDNEAQIMREIINQTVEEDGAKVATEQTPSRRRGGTSTARNVPSNTQTTMSSNTPIGGTVGNERITPSFGENQARPQSDSTGQAPNQPGATRQTAPNQPEDTRQPVQNQPEVSESPIQGDGTRVESSYDPNHRAVTGVNIADIPLKYDFRNVETSVIVEEVISKIERDLNGNPENFSSKMKNNIFTDVKKGIKNTIKPTKLPAEQREKYVQAITKYVEAMKKMQNQEVPTFDNNQTITFKPKKEEKKQIEQQAKAKVTRRMKKFEQMLQFDIENGGTGDVEVLLGQDSDTQGLNRLTAKEITQLFRDVKKTNKELAELYPTLSTTEQKKKLKALYAAGREYIPLSMEVESFKKEHADLYYADYNSLSEEDRLKVRKIKSIEAQLPEKRRAYKQAKKTEDNAGPLNMNNLFNLITHVH